MSQTHTNAATGYEIRYQSLFNEGRAFSFPCDEQGHVDLDALSPKSRGNYLFARAMVGREYACPTVQACRACPVAPACPRRREALACFALLGIV